MYKAVLLPPPKNAGRNLSSAQRAALSLSQAKAVPSEADKASASSSSSTAFRKQLYVPPSEALHNPEFCMRPGDLPAKEGDVFAIKKFKPDKEGDVQTYAGISQSGAREIMVSCFL